MPGSASSVLPKGIKGNPLKGFLRETHLNQGTSAPGTQWLLKNMCQVGQLKRSVNTINSQKLGKATGTIYAHGKNPKSI